MINLPVMNLVLDELPRILQNIMFFITFHHCGFPSCMSFTILSMISIDSHLVEAMFHFSLVCPTAC